MSHDRRSERPTRYPGYDVLAKRNSPSWDDRTRAVIDERLAVDAEPHFFNAVEWLAAKALCRRIVPQADAEPFVPLAAMLDNKLAQNAGDGYRHAQLPPAQQAWRTGLAALDAECRKRHDLPFSSLDKPQQIALIEQMQRGELTLHTWREMPCALFFTERVLHDICGLYYSHPHAWSELGFGGPANPRGYVRLYFDRRDPWEAIENNNGDDATVRKENRRVR